MRISGYAVFTFKFYKEGKRWTAYCDELGTATFGRSLPEADKKLSEAVLLHLNTLEEVGERERFFREHNIDFYQARPKKDIQVCLPARKDVFVHSHIQPIHELSAV